MNDTKLSSGQGVPYNFKQNKNPLKQKDFKGKQKRRKQEGTI